MDLQNPETLEIYRSMGFVWIRQLHDRRFHEIVRNPTIGCIVEMFAIRHADCVQIDSPKGKKLINKICYF